MNIVRLCYEWPPSWAGLAPGPYELSCAQTALGHQIRYLAGGWPGRPVAPAAHVNVRRLPKATRRLSLFATTAVAALPWSLAWSRWADIVHGHGHLPIYYHMWRRYLRDSTPYVLHLHITAAGRAANTSPAALNFWSRRWEWPLHELSDRVGCQTAGAVICSSDSVRDEAIRFYHTDPAKLHVVNNGVNTDRFAPNGADRRHDFGFSDSDIVVLFVGSLTQRKRPLLLLNALQHLPQNWKLLFVGRGPLQTDLEQQTQRLGLQQRVRIVGFLPYPQLPAIYRSADLFALPASYEGYPKVILEALACGLPIVMTPSFTPDERLQPFIRICDATPVEIARNLQLARAIEVDVKLIRREYSWRTRARQIDAIYQTLL